MWTNQSRQRAERAAQYRAITEAGEEQRPSANQNQAWVTFRETYPDVAQWMFDNSSKNAFAKSLYDQAVARGYLSQKQIDAVRGNINKAPGPRNGGGFDVTKLFTVLQKHAKFYAGRLTITRKNGDTLCWVLWDDGCVGKLEEGRAVLFSSRAKGDLPEIRALLEEFEAAPLAAAVKYGKLSGRCCSCGRELTNDGSIEAGIGPICAQKFG